MAQATDTLELGGFYTSDYLKNSGELSARSVGTIYDFRRRISKSYLDDDVKRWQIGAYQDTSPVYEVMPREVVEISDYNVNLGNIPYIIPITILCELKTVSTTEETMWPAAEFATNPQRDYVRKDTAQAMTIESTSAEDTYLTGVGLWTAKVSFLNNNYEFKQEVAQLNGLTPVPLTSDLGLAVNEINPETSGVNPGAANPRVARTAQGNLIVRAADGDILAVIAAGTVRPINITRQGIFTVPARARFEVRKCRAESGEGDDITVTIYAVNPVNGVYVRQLELRVYQGATEAVNGEWLHFPEKHLLEACALSTRTGTKEVTLRISGVLIIEDLI